MRRGPQRDSWIILEIRNEAHHFFFVNDGDGIGITGMMEQFLRTRAIIRFEVERLMASAVPVLPTTKTTLNFWTSSSVPRPNLVLSQLCWWQLDSLVV